MKKLTALLLIPVILITLASCGKGDSSKSDSKKDSGKGNSVSQAADEKGKDKDNKDNKESAKESTTVDYSKVLKDLNRKELKFVDSLGKTEKGKKIVAFFGDDFETQFIVADFKDGKVSLAKNYRFYKDKNKFEAYKILAENDKKNKTGFVIHEKEMCVEQTETRKYRGKTYDEMVELLQGYDYKR